MTKKERMKNNVFQLKYFIVFLDKKDENYNIILPNCGTNNEK